MCKICHIFILFVAIATRIFNIGRKEKDVHNLHTAIYPYTKFHKKIFSTFQVLAGSSFVDGRTDWRTDRRTEGKPKTNYSQTPNCNIYQKRIIPLSFMLNQTEIITTSVINLSDYNVFSFISTGSILYRILICRRIRNV
jgi:hypothetical protein